jgi:WD40-like Beta Propeller Repeat
MRSIRNVLTAVVLFALLAFATPEYSPWSAPVNLGAVVNSPFADVGPAVSKDGLSLYFGSDRPGGFGGVDIWVSQRASLESPWGAPMNLGQVINTENAENIPAFSGDGHWMFFNSTRPGGLGGVDLWVSYREHTKDDFGWQQPVNLGAAVNTAFNDQGAGYFQNDHAGPLLFFGSDRPGGFGANDIYVSQIFPDGSLSPARLVPELSSHPNDQRPSVRFDGLELVFFSDRAGSLGGVDLWTATRETVFHHWSTPTNLGPLVNGPENDQTPYLADLQTLYFSSNRLGGLGQVDLYVTTRTKHP